VYRKFLSSPVISTQMTLFFLYKFFQLHSINHVQDILRECDFGPPDYSPGLKTTLDPLTLVPLRLQTPTRQQTPQHCPHPLLVGGAVVD